MEMEWAFFLSPANRVGVYVLLYSIILIYNVLNSLSKHSGESSTEIDVVLFRHTRTTGIGWLWRIRNKKKFTSKVEWQKVDFGNDH